jgi:hypothetical protein
VNPLIDMFQHIAVALTAEPQLLLASAVAAFDPFWGEAADEGETDPLLIALHVSRTVFPEMYVDATQLLQSGANMEALNRFFCNAFTAQGLPLPDLELIGWGVPLDACGVNLEDIQFYEEYPELNALMGLFGITLPDSSAYAVELPEGIYALGRALAVSLHQQSDLNLQQVGWLLGWVFSCTGNSLIDYTLEDLAELQPLSWSQQDIAFAIELIEEANGVIQDVKAGIAMLNTSPDLMAALERNIAILDLELKQKGKLDEHAPRLEWARTDGGAHGETVADPLVLQLRADAA